MLKTRFHFIKQRRDALNISFIATTTTTASAQFIQKRPYFYALQPIGMRVAHSSLHGPFSESEIMELRC